MSINRLITTSDKYFLQQIAQNTLGTGTDITTGSPTDTQAQLQQNGIYGNNPLGAWKALKVATDGTLAVSSSSTTVVSKTYTALDTNATKTTGQLSAIINIGDATTFQLVGNTTTQHTRIGIAYESVGGYYTDGIFGTTYYDGTNYQFNLIIRNIPSQNIKILYQTAASNVNLAYSYY